MSDLFRQHQSDEDQEDQFRQLISDARAGSKTALGELIESCRPYLLLIANQELEPVFTAKTGASDVVQETLMSAQLCLNQFRGNDRNELLGWLRSILINDLKETRRHYRTQGRLVDREMPLTEIDSLRSVQAPTSPAHTPSSEAVIREQRKILGEAMKRLNDEDRQIVQLRSWERLSFREIGERTGRSTEAARKRWSRAILRLQCELDQLEP